MLEAQKLLRVTVVKGKNEREYDLDAESVTLHQFYDALHRAVSSGGALVLRDDQCCLAVNITNIEDVYAELIDSEQ